MSELTPKVAAEWLRQLFPTHPYAHDLKSCGDIIESQQEEIERLQNQLSAFQKSEFHPDWSLLEASQASIREHQKTMKEWREAIKELTLAETPEENTDRVGTLLEMTGLLADL